MEPKVLSYLTAATAEELAPCRHNLLGERFPPALLPFAVPSQSLTFSMHPRERSGCTAGCFPLGCCSLLSRFLRKQWITLYLKKYIYTTLCTQLWEGRGDGGSVIPSTELLQQTAHLPACSPPGWAQGRGHRAAVRHRRDRTKGITKSSCTS